MLKPCIYIVSLVALTSLNFIDFSVFIGLHPLSVGFFLFTCKTTFFYQYCLFVLSFLINAGDPALLHMQIRDCNLDMQSIEKMSLHALRDLCEKCSIPVSTVKSQVIFQLVVCVM